MVYSFYTRTPAFGYVGPGDIVPGAVGWWGLRAYSHATVNTKAVRIRRLSDNLEMDFNTRSNGNLDNANISGFLSGTSGAVVKLYDQVNGYDVAQATAGNQPTFLLNAIGSFSAVQFIRANSTVLSLVSSAFNKGNNIAQPWTTSQVSSNYLTTTTGTYSPAGITGDLGSDSFGVYFDNNVTHKLDLYSGGTGLEPSTAVSIGTFYALQGVANGASSDINVDGVPTTGNSGSLPFGSNTIAIGQDGHFANWSELIFLETGVWGKAFAASDSLSMSNNQQAYWGFVKSGYTGPLDIIP